MTETTKITTRYDELSAEKKSFINELINALASERYDVRPKSCSEGFDLIERISSAAPCYDTIVCYRDYGIDGDLHFIEPTVGALMEFANWNISGEFSLFALPDGYNLVKKEEV